jgi:hypothetical protein
MSAPAKCTYPPRISCQVGRCRRSTLKWAGSAKISKLNPPPILTPGSCLPLIGQIPLVCLVFIFFLGTAPASGQLFRPPSKFPSLVDSSLDVNPHARLVNHQIMVTQTKRICRYYLHLMNISPRTFP